MHATVPSCPVKEVYEELGIKIKPEDLFLVGKGKTESRMHFFENFAYIFDGGLKDLHFSDGEIIEAKWYAFDSYVKNAEKFPERWCNSLSNENYLKIMEWIQTQ